MSSDTTPAASPALLSTWAGSHVFTGGPVVQPRNLDELVGIVASSRKVRAIGSRHSFHDIADSPGTLVALDRLDLPLEIDEDAGTVTVAAGMRYGQLAQELDDRGWALHTMASLPHIAVAGTIATATHGSGDGVQNLSAAVRGLEIVAAGGKVRRIGPEHPEFGGSVVALGALGVVSRVTLAIQPRYEVAQEVWLGLPWRTALSDLDALTSSAYSVSLFTDWRGERIRQVWRKHRVPLDAGQDWSAPPAGPELDGARRATANVHPLPGPDASACTAQGGLRGPWHERLPHFRAEFTPSAGKELQSEWLVPREHAVAAIETMRDLGELTSPLLFVSEIRTIAGDDLWLSTAHGGDRVGIHMTWHPRRDEVEAVLPTITSALAPFGARPHWGKLFAGQRLDELYPRWDDARALIAQHDPEGIFANDYLTRVGLA